MKPNMKIFDIMKQIIIALSAVIAAMMLASCNQELLDIPQKGVYAEEDFYKTDEDCLQAVAAIWTSIRGNTFWYKSYQVFNYPGDDLYKGSSGYKLDDAHTLMLGIYDDTHSDVKSVFQTLYQIVYRCNLITDNFEGKDSAIMKQACAEAKTIRSWCYLYLIQAWGNPPIIDHVLRTTADFAQPNASTEDLWKFVINSCDEAINSGSLPSKSNANDKTQVRTTKEFAMAVKGKAQVLSGDYSGAKTTLKAIIDSGKYELIPSEQLSELFWSVEGNHNCESLFEVNLVMTEENASKISANDHNFYTVPRIDRLPVTSGSWLSTYIDGNQYFQASYPFLKAMIEHEGTQSYRFKAWFWTYEDMQALGLKEMRGQRSSSTQKLIDGCVNGVSSELASDTKKDHTGEICGIWHRKMTPKPDDCFQSNMERNGIDRRYFRYAEVLLLYAEACAQLGETSGPGLDALNAVAKRAGAPLYDKLSMENLKTEKRFEMYGEMCRFFDLVRWGDAATVLADHWNTLPVFYGYKKGMSAADITPDGRNTFDVYEICFFDVKTFTGQGYGFKTGRDEHLPYPSKELSNNTAIVQNPGW